MSKKHQLQELHKRMSDCQLCPLSKDRTRLVFGGGNPEAKMMIIGEAPGYEENLKGEVFVGKSGHLLDQILAACGFNRDFVYISNMVKCRPPGNRKPAPAEMKACHPSLMRQIQIVDPLILIPMGATALNELISKDLRISKDRGKWIEWLDRKVLPVYHPSALLRNPDLKRDAWADFQEIFHAYRRLVDPHHHSEHIHTN
jgi:DNA polymerase